MDFVEDGKVVEYTLQKNSGDLEAWMKTVSVPKFDPDGHEYIYQVVETNYNMGASDNGIDHSYIEAVAKFIPETQTYRMDNIIGDGDADSMSITKFWIDDGELEYRNNIHVDFKNLLIKSPDGTDSYTLDDYSSFLINGVQSGEPIDLTHAGYYTQNLESLPTTDQNGDGLHWRYQYNPANFTEHIRNTRTENYTYAAALTGDISDLADGAKWIYAVKSSSYNDKLANIGTKEVDGQTVNITNYYDLTKDSAYAQWLNEKFNYGSNLQYVYQTDGHYYAVCYETSGYYNEQTHTYNAHPSELRIFNYRIGVINYEVDLSWLVGNALNQDIITGITLQISGGGHTFNVPIENLKELNNSGKKFYILNLPKYEIEYGKEIEYTIQEVSITTSYSDGHGGYKTFAITDGECIIENETNDNDVCLVTIDVQDTIKNISNSNSDDIIPVEISNKFSASREISVTKVWKDDHDSTGRNGLYLQLYQQSEAPGSAASAKSTRWYNEKKADEWIFTYEGLDRYDSNGYEYIYSVKEVSPVPGYKSEYDNSEAADTAQINKMDTTKAYNGVSIVNTRVGTITQSGEKSWKNINTGYQNNLYPVAYVYLYAKYKGVDYEALQAGSSNTVSTLPYNHGNRKKYFYGDSIDHKQIQGELVAIATIYNGDTVYEFKEGNNLKNFPMYDAEGAEITYYIDEEAINGYSINMNVDGTLINDYHGDSRLKYTVHKEWANRAPSGTPFPSVTITLHQAIRVQAGETLQRGTVINVGKSNERKLTSDTVVSESCTIDYHTFTCTLRNGANEYVFNDLAVYDPRGNPFVYYVTEKMTDADGDTTTQELDIQSADGDRALGYHSTVNVVNDNAGTENDKIFNITNTYDPDHTNFQTKIDVTKNWKIYRTFSQGNYGSDFTFTLSRQTSKIGKKDLFTIYSGGRTVVQDTGNPGQYVNESAIPTIDLSVADHPTFTITASDADNGIYKYGQNPIFVSIGDNKYKTIVNFTKSDYTVYGTAIPVTITVDLSNADRADNPVNVVTIEGLAKYAQDGVRYTYTATEVVPTGFSRSPSKIDGESVDESSKKFEEDSSQLSLVLNNDQSLSNVRIAKVFGAILLDDNDSNAQYTVRLPKDDYALFFDQNYINSLRFTVYADSLNDQYDYQITINGNQLYYPSEEQVAAGFDPGVLYFTNLVEDSLINKYPTLDPTGQAYSFTVVETSTSPSTEIKTYGSVSLDEYSGTFDESLLLPNGEYTDNRVAVSNGQTAFFANAFPAKVIDIEKKWDDNDNADGMRPDHLVVGLKETDNSDAEIVTVDKLLTNSGSWQKTGIYVPRVNYYNAQVKAVKDIELTENLSEAIDSVDNNRYKAYADVIGDSYRYHYGLTELADDAPGGNLSVAGYTQLTGTIAGTDYDDLKIMTAGDQNDKLLTVWNQKERLNGKINIQKRWEDYDNKWGERPDSIYVMIQRKLEEEPAATDDPAETGGSDEGGDDPGGGDDPSSGGDPGESGGSGDDGFVTVLTDYNNTAIGTNGIIEIRATDTDINNAPWSKIISDLPFGENTGGAVNANGTFRRYIYRVVECSSTGVIYDHESSDSSANAFGYTWGQTIQPVTGEDEEKVDSSTFVPTLSEGVYNKTELDSAVTNTQKTVDHTVYKKWEDENDYYNSRDNYKLALQRKLETDDDTHWTAVNHPASGGNAPQPAEYTVDAASTNQKRTGADGNYTYPTEPDDGYMTEASVSGFEELPAYDKNGVKYLYRVVETKIGSYSVDTAETPHHTNNYAVTYDDDYSDDATTITNTLIRKPPLIHVVVEKQWDDNANQDGQRKPVRFILKQTWLDHESIEHETTYPETVDHNSGDANTSWKHTWSNVPMYSPEGYLYNYEVVEDITDVTGYSQQGMTVTNETNDNGNTRTYTFTNKYTPKTQSLTINKNWNDQSDLFGLRPDKVKFVLYCSYDDGAGNSYSGKAGEGTNAVKDILGTSYAYAIEAGSGVTGVTVNGNQWSYSFSGLPVRVNPTGTATEYGVSVDVTYWVVEEVPELTASGYDYSRYQAFSAYEYKENNVFKGYAYPYVPDDASESSHVTLNAGENNALSPTDQTVAIGNKLNTRDITVAKSWNDQDYMKNESDEATVLQGMHYNTTVTLGSDEWSGLTGRQVSGKYSETKVIGKADKNGVKFTDLPIYNSKGEVIAFYVEEKYVENAAASAGQITNVYHDAAVTVSKGASSEFRQGDTIYCYDGSCKKETAGFVDTTKDYVTQYNILDTLPLTAVTVEKTWTDQSDVFGLRPSVPTGTDADPLNLVLRAKSVASASLSDETVTGAGTAGWAVPQYSIKSQPTASNNTWTYTYTKLLKYDKANQPYIFRIEETKLPAYQTPVYPAQVVTAIDANDSADWDGTDPLTSALTVTNTLDTRDIVVTKTWENNGYTAEDTVYAIDVTLSSPTLTCTDSSKNNGTNASLYQQTITIATGGNLATFSALPIFDQNGNVIVYHVKEAAHSGNASPAQARTPTVTKAAGSTDTLAAGTVPTFTDGDRHYGYVGSAVYTADHRADQPDKFYLTQVDITNTLPLTAVNVVKNWDDQSDGFGLRPAIQSAANTTDPLGLFLQRGTGTTWENTAPSYTMNPTYPAASGNTWTYTYTKILKYNEANTAYRFKITEKPGGTETNLNGYTMPKYCKPSESGTARQTLTGTQLETLSSGTTWDGTTPLADAMEITNSLDTRDILVTKTWDDQGYRDTTIHYDIAVTLSNSSLVCSESGRNANGKYQETKILAKDSTSALVFKSLPKYDSSGNEITYAIWESLPSGTYSVASGTDLTATYAAATETAVSAFTPPVDGERKYGYVGTCTKVTATETVSGASKTYVEQYDIKNTLPVYDFNADIEWLDDNNRDGIRPSEMNVVLKRKISTDTDKATVVTQSSKTNGTETWNYALGTQLRFDENNNAYTYSIDESAKTGGTFSSYSRAYSKSITMVTEGTPSNNTAEAGPYESADKDTTATASSATFHMVNSYTPQVGSVTLVKNWEETLSGYDYKNYTRPNTITLTLKRKYEGGSDETVQDVALSIDRTTDSFSDTVSNLYLNTNPTGSKIANGASKVYTYYLDEGTVPSGYQIKAYSPAQATGVQLNTTTAASLSVTNELKTKTITVKKLWQDNGYTPEPHYTVTANVELVNVSPVATVQSIADVTTEGVTITVPEFIGANDAKFKVTETNQHYGYEVSYQIGSGAYSTTATEFFINNSDLISGNYTVTLKNTLPLVQYTAHKVWNDENNRDYVRPASITFNLQRSLASDIPDAALTAAEIALKSTPEVVATLSATPTSWYVDFGKQLKYSDSNKPYIYEVVEVEDSHYSKSMEQLGNTTTLADGTEKTDYQFTNTHTVDEKSLIVRKLWNDNRYDYKDTLRPTNLDEIEVELWCRYLKADGTWADEKVDTDNRVRDHINSTVAAGSSYDYDPELDDFASVDDYTRTYTFQHLPVYINVDGTATTAGTTVKQAVYYYVKEKFNSSANGYIYQADYSNDNSSFYTTPGYTQSGSEYIDPTGTTLVNGSESSNKTIYVRNTPQMRDILVAKTWEDHGYGAASQTTGMTDLSKNLHYKTAFELNSTSVSYDVTLYLAKADSEAGKGVVFKDVPIYDKNGNVIVYKVTEWLDNDASHAAATGDNLDLRSAAKWQYYTLAGDSTECDCADFEQLTDGSNRRYGYVGSAQIYTTPQTRGAATDPHVMICEVTDTLPLTAVEADKHWIDQHNEFNLRPSGINDANKGETTADRISLTIARSDTGTYEHLRPSTAAQYTEWYETASVTNNSSDEWTHTYKKLLKYNANNVAYTFEITEAQVVPYEVPHYCAAGNYEDSGSLTAAQYVTDVEANGGKEWNGQNILTEKFEITNKLIVRDLTVTKSWEDENNTNGARYDIDVTLSSSQANNGAYNDENYLDPNDDTTDTLTRNSSNSTYQETRTITAKTNGGTQVVFYRLPIYDKSGHVIVYDVREDADPKNSSSASDRTAVNISQKDGTAETLNGTLPTFTDGDRHFGYIGSAVYTALKDVPLTGTDTTTSQPYASQYDITNTLPLTKIKVTKHWNVDESYHKYVGTYMDGLETKNYRDVDVTLTRTSSGSSTDNTPSNIIGSLSDVATIPFDSTSMEYTYANLLVYDYTNTQYIYKAAEKLKGYTTAYSHTPSGSSTLTDGTVPAVQKTSTDDPLEMDITNTMITGNANVAKVDGTLYNEYNGWVKKTIGDTYFQLFINSDTPVYVYLSDGYYVIDNRAGVTRSNIVKSDANGEIRFKDMPLNSYHLTECQDTASTPLPEGYNWNATNYYFRIDVPDAAATSASDTVYGTDGNSITYLGNPDRDPVFNLIGNYETVTNASLSLEKRDEIDSRIKLEDATYYIVRMKPYEMRQASDSEMTLEAYLAAADQVLKDAVNAVNNGSAVEVFTDAVQVYWGKVGTTGYTTDTNGKIGPIESETNGIILLEGRYTFLEVQATEGYDLAFIEPQYLTDTHKTLSFVQDEPRKSADLKIYKQDEFENPLDGAEFDLYYQPDDLLTYSISSAIAPPFMMVSPSNNNPGHPDPTVSTTTSYQINSTIETPTKSEIQVITPRTDNDYIFFKDNTYSGARWKNDILNTSYNSTDSSVWNYHLTLGDLQENGGDIYAAFFGPGSGESNWIANYVVWERFVQYESGSSEVIWKIQPPDGATRVKFYQNGGNSTKIFTFTKGDAYWKKGNGSDVYIGGTWHWTTTPGTRGKSYEPTANKIIFRRNSEYCWDNIHIEFFDADQNPIHQEFPGYLMEPYAYADSAYRINFTNNGSNDKDERYYLKDKNQYGWGNLCYELTIPKDAVYFRINNGVWSSGNSSDINGVYRTAITRIETDTTRKNNGNYWEIKDSDWNNHGTEIPLTNWNQNQVVNIAHDQWNADPELTFEAESDHDYVYFCNTQGWPDDNGKMYAYYYGGGDLQENNWQRAVYSIWPGIESVGSFKYGSYTVYKFRRPMGDRKAYSSVIFNNGHTAKAGGKATANIGIYPKSTYQLGYMYYNDSYTDNKNTGAIRNYTVYADPNATERYTLRGDYLYILNTANWDNLHVQFFNASEAQIHQSNAGYVLKDSGTNQYGHWYRVPIPSDAAQFSINNGRANNSIAVPGVTTAKMPIYRKANSEEPAANDYTLGNILYELTGSQSSGTLTVLYPKFDTIITSTGADNYAVDYAKRGDFLYIANIGNLVLKSGDTITGKVKFYDTNGSLIAGSTYTNGEYPLKDSGTRDGADWYKLEIPSGAVKFDLMHDGGTISDNPIYPKMSAPQISDNVPYTPGDMYYSTAVNALTVTYPVFTGGSSGVTWSYTGRNGTDGDHLYLVHDPGESWASLAVTFTDGDGVVIEPNVPAEKVGALTYGNPPDDHYSTNIVNAVGTWWKVPIPAGAEKFIVSGSIGGTAQQSDNSGIIYELLSAEDDTRNDYTLGDMVYHITSGMSIALDIAYPKFTVKGGTEQVDDTVDEEDIRPADPSHTTYSYSPITTPTDYSSSTQITQVPVVHQTDTGLETVSWTVGTSSSPTDHNVYFVKNSAVSSWTEPIVAHFWVNGNATGYPVTMTYSYTDTSGNSVYQAQVPNENVDRLKFQYGNWADGTRELTLVNHGYGSVYTPAIPHALVFQRTDLNHSGGKIYADFYNASNQSLGSPEGGTFSGDNTKWFSIPNGATKVRFTYGDDNWATGYLNLNSGNGYGYGKYYKASNGETPQPMDPFNYSNLVSWSGTSDSWTDGVANEAVNANYTLTYQPEDRYDETGNYIYIDNNGSWTADNIRVTFLDDSNNEIGVLTKDGSASNEAKAMKPTAATGSDYQYKVLLPKQATTVTLSNGTTTYTMTVSPGGIYHTSGGTITARNNTASSAVIQSIDNLSTRTDSDYIYFTDTDNIIRGTDTSAVVYAYYFGGPYGEFTSLDSSMEPVRTYLDTNGHTVYVFQPPSVISDYPKVIFTNGSLDPTQRKMTTAIDYALGKGYRSTTATQHYGPTATGGSTYVQAAAVDTRTVSSTDTSYTPSTRRFTFIMNGTVYSPEFYYWDNAHIVFYKEGSTSDKTYAWGTSLLDVNVQVVGDPNGYVLYENDNSHLYEPFVIDVPVDATYFRITNGADPDGVVRYSELASIETGTSGNIKYPKYQFLRPAQGAGNYPSTVSGYYPIQWMKAVPSEPDQPSLTTEPVKLATVVTGYDGLPAYIKWLKRKPVPGAAYDPDDPTTYDSDVVDDEYLANTIADEGKSAGVKSVKVVKWGTYYWVEKSYPTGYKAAGEDKLDTFTIGAEQAEMSVFIYKAPNERIKGKVTLTKTAKEAAGITELGSVIENAQFTLYRYNEETGDYDIEVKLRYEDEIYVPDENESAVLTTDVNGKFTIEELDWGRYKLVETNAPSGYKTTITDVNNVEQPNMVYFTVGRNNCELMQQLTCKDESEKAKLMITKNIDDHRAAWGEATFIFKVTQTAKLIDGTLTSLMPAEQKTIVIPLTMAEGTFTASTDYISVAPGSYQITELHVSRYDYGSCTYNTENSNGVTNWIVDNSAGLASFTVSKANEQDGKIEIIYNNLLQYYDKFSQVDVKVNKFHGYKGIRVEYHQPIAVTDDPAELLKKNITVYKILSNGREEPITDKNELNQIAYSYVAQAKDDPNFASDFSDNTSGNKLEISNPSRYMDCVYRLRATYHGFSCDFDVNFVEKNHQPKVYQKTFNFKADTDNLSYFNDELDEVTNRTTIYSFVFTMVKDNNGLYQVYSVTHNGEVVAEGDTIAASMAEKLSLMQSRLTVNEAYDEAKAFDYWSYGSVPVNIEYSYLETLAKLNADTETFTAVLKPVS